MIGLLKYLDIEELNDIAQMSKETVKHIVNKCVTEKAFKELQKCMGKKNYLRRACNAKLFNGD